jgi:F-type H+-transporting ATPase subunit epsilon
VEERFLELDEHERKTRTALARLEAGTLRGFRELQEKFHG